MARPLEDLARDLRPGPARRGTRPISAANDNGLEWMNEFVFVPVTTMLNRMAGDRANQKVAYINVQARDAGEMDKAMDETTAILKRAHGGV